MAVIASILDFQIATPERILTKLDRNQVLNLFYQDCVRLLSFNNDGVPGLWLTNFL